MSALKVAGSGSLGRKLFYDDLEGEQMTASSYIVSTIYRELANLSCTLCKEYVCVVSPDFFLTKIVGTTTPLSDNFFHGFQNFTVLNMKSHVMT